MKQIALDMSRFQVAEQEKEQYEHYVNLTAKLLKRKYFTVHLMFERDKWDIDKIKRAYHNAVKYSGDMPSDVYWWWQRKVNKKK